MTRSGLPGVSTSTRLTGSPRATRPSTPRSASGAIRSVVLTTTLAAAIAGRRLRTLSLGRLLREQ
jgi:hypothetical protein